MTRSAASGSSWLEALRVFSTFRRQLQNPALSVSAASSAAAPSAVTPYPDGKNRLQLYELVAHAQLFGPPGSRVSAENLRVLRAARWELMQIGSPRNKSILLERILQLYTEAAKALFYDPVPSQAERQSLLLEQMQCLVEAKVAEVPLTVRHYRHPLQAPQLSEVGGELPLVLLQEIENAERAKAQRHAPSATRIEGDAVSEKRELVAARLDCAVGLASSGYVDAALRLCTADGFPYVIRQVAQRRRDGWKQAWALADAVPLALLISSRERSKASRKDVQTGHAATHKNEMSKGDDDEEGEPLAESAGWLHGVLDAAVRRYRASSDPAVRDWVRSFMRVWSEGRTKNNSKELGDSFVAVPLPLRVMETYLAVCPASAWREAVEIVMCYNSTGFPFPTPEHTSLPAVKRGGDGNDSAVATGTDDDVGDGFSKVGIGRLMTLLNVAEQPEEILKLFYGSFFTVELLARRQEELEGVGSSFLRGMPRGGAEPSAEEGPEAIWCASDEFLSPADMLYPATYNHAMLAIAKLGYWRVAMTFYKRLPASLANRHTHWTAARMFIHPFPSTGSSSSSSSASSVARNQDTETLPDFMREDDGVYEFCLACLKRACVNETTGKETAAASTATTTTTATATTSPANLSFPDVEPVFEGLALWAAAREDWQTAVWLSSLAPHGCRYIKLIAFASLLQSYRPHSTTATASTTSFTEAGRTALAGELSPIPAEVLHRFPSFRPRYRPSPGRQHQRRESNTDSYNTNGVDKVSVGGQQSKGNGQDPIGDARAVELARQMDALLSAHDASVKQVCLLLAFVANSAVAVQLLGVARGVGKDQKDESEACEVLRPEVVSGFVTVLGRHVNGSQDGLDHAIAILMDDFFSLRQRQDRAKRTKQPARAFSAGPRGAGAERPNGAEALHRQFYCPSFKRSKVLAEVMHLAGGIEGNEEGGWRVILQVLSSLGTHQGLSVARAAPAMVSAGMKAEFAIKFLDS